MNHKVCLVDRVLTNSNRFKIGPKSENGIRTLLQNLPNATVINADGLEIAYGKPGGAWRMEDFFNIAPPFNSFWIEWSSSSLTKNNIKRTGVLFTAQEFGPCSGTLLIEDRSTPVTGRWLLHCQEIWETKDMGLVYGVESNVFVDVDGRCIGCREVPSNFDSVFRFSISRMAFFAIQFLHCKNVGLTVQEPDAKFSKAFQKRHGRPLTRYHTLEIEPMKEVLRTEGNIAQNGLKKALHICRGHFSTYTPERPLFGKVAGTFWVPSHVRGKAENGIVVKDYAVKL